MQHNAHWRYVSWCHWRNAQTRVLDKTEHALEHGIAWHSSGSKMPPVDAAEACFHYQCFCAYVDVFCLNRCCGSIIAVLHVLPGAVTGHSEGYMTRWIYIRSSSHMVSLSIIGTKTLPFHSASCKTEK